MNTGLSGPGGPFGKSCNDLGTEWDCLPTQCRLKCEVDTFTAVLLWGAIGLAYILWRAACLVRLAMKSRAPPPPSPCANPSGCFEDTDEFVSKNIASSCQPVAECLPPSGASYMLPS